MTGCSAARDEPAGRRREGDARRSREAAEQAATAMRRRWSRAGSRRARVGAVVIGPPPPGRGSARLVGRQQGSRMALAGSRCRCSSATDTSSGRWVTAMTMRCSASRMISWLVRSATSGSRWAVGSSRSSSGSVASQARASASRCRWPAERPAVVPDPGREPVGERGDRLVEGDGSKGRPQLVVGDGAADGSWPSVRLVLMEPAARKGRCVT